MTALANTGVPVPEVRLFCEDTSVLGTPFFAYKFVEGRFFKSPELASIPTAAERTQLFHNTIKTLAQVLTQSLRC